MSQPFIISALSTLTFIILDLIGILPELWSSWYIAVIYGALLVVLYAFVLRDKLVYAWKHWNEGRLIKELIGGSIGIGVLHILQVRIAHFILFSTFCVQNTVTQLFCSFIGETYFLLPGRRYIALFVTIYISLLPANRKVEKVKAGSFNEVLSHSADALIEIDKKEWQNILYRNQRGEILGFSKIIKNVLGKKINKLKSYKLLVQGLRGSGKTTFSKMAIYHLHTLFQKRKIKSASPSKYKKLIPIVRSPWYINSATLEDNFLSTVKAALLQAKRVPQIETEINQIIQDLGHTTGGRIGIITRLMRQPQSGIDELIESLMFIINKEYSEFHITIVIDEIDRVTQPHLTDVGRILDIINKMIGLNTAKNINAIYCWNNQYLSQILLPGQPCADDTTSMTSIDFEMYFGRFKDDSVDLYESTKLTYARYISSLIGTYNIPEHKLLILFDELQRKKILVTIRSIQYFKVLLNRVMDEYSAIKQYDEINIFQGFRADDLKYIDLAIGLIYYSIIYQERPSLYPGNNSKYQDLLHNIRFQDDDDLEKELQQVIEENEPLTFYANISTDYHSTIDNALMASSLWFDNRIIIDSLIRGPEFNKQSNNISYAIGKLENKLFHRLIWGKLSRQQSDEAYILIMKYADKMKYGPNQSDDHTPQTSVLITGHINYQNQNIHPHSQTTYQSYTETTLYQLTEQGESINIDVFYNFIQFLITHLDDFFYVETIALYNKIFYTKTHLLAKVIHCINQQDWRHDALLNGIHAPLQDDIFYATAFLHLLSKTGYSTESRGVNTVAHIIAGEDEEINEEIRTKTHIQRGEYIFDFIGEHFESDTSSIALKIKQAIWLKLYEKLDQHEELYIEDYLFETQSLKQIGESESSSFTHMNTIYKVLILRHTLLIFFENNYVDMRKFVKVGCSQETQVLLLCTFFNTSFKLTERVTGPNYVDLAHPEVKDIYYRIASYYGPELINCTVLYGSTGFQKVAKKMQKKHWKEIVNMMMNASAKYQPTPESTDT